MARLPMVPPAAFADAIHTRYQREFTHLYFDPDRPWTLLFAVLLSAQCTDARVNLTTPQLWQQFPDLEAIVAKPLEELQQALSSITFYKNKGKHIQQAAGMLLLQHDGQVPRTMDELTALPGVGRKTANVVAHVLFGINLGFVVDTHIKRITYRAGLTKHTDPIKIEKDLMKRFPRNIWGSTAHKIVQFGRDICDARKPKCTQCPLRDLCPKHGVTTSA